MNNDKKQITLGLKVLTIVSAIGFLVGAVLSCERPHDIGIETVTYSVTKKEFVGANNGVSFEGSPSATSGSKSKVDDGLFISQYPLVEYRYIMDVVYDSVVRYTIDEVTLDTLEVYNEMVPKTRDTIGFKKGNIWMPFDDQVRTKLYIGLDEQFIDSTDITLTITTTDNYEVENSGLLIVCLNGTTICYVDGTSTVEIDATIPQRVTQIPVYGEDGRVSSYKNGIELTDILFKNFKVTKADSLLRTFNITITTSNGTSASADFNLNFVTQGEYVNRLCWLKQEFNCRDLYTE